MQTGSCAIEHTGTVLNTQQRLTQRHALTHALRLTFPGGSRPGVDGAGGGTAPRALLDGWMSWMHVRRIYSRTRFDLQTTVANAGRSRTTLPVLVGRESSGSHAAIDDCIALLTQPSRQHWWILGGYSGPCIQGWRPTSSGKHHLELDHGAELRSRPFFSLIFSLPSLATYV